MTNLILTKSRHLEPFAAVLRANGFSVLRLLKKARLPATCLKNLDTLVPADNMVRFREFAAKTTGNPKIALDSTRHLDFETMGSLGRTLLTEPTLGGLLHKFRELAATESSNVIFELYPRCDGDLWFGHRLRCHTDSSTWQTSLYALSWMLQLVRLADPTWLPTEILIDTTDTPDRQNAINDFGAKSRFRQKNTGFFVPLSMLALPIRKENRYAEGEDADIWATAPASTYAESLKQVFRSYAEDGWLSIEQASEVTHTSVRTLQRRLMEEQKTYSGLIRETRTEMAAGLLVETEFSIAEIARQLGYLKQGNFTRAFYRWAKVSPSEFRKARGKARKGVGDK